MRSVLRKLKRPARPARYAGLDLLGSAVVIVDDEGRIKYLNTAAAEAFEISESISDLSTVKHRGFEELNEEAAEHTDRKETEETSIKASE